MSEQSKNRVEELAVRLATESIGAIDYGINAKALALQDAAIREKLEGLLDDGFRVKRIESRAGTGASALSFAVTFHLERSNEASAMDDTQAFTAVLELPTRTVKDILEGDVPSPAGTDAPFALNVGGRGSEPVPVDDFGGGRPGLPGRPDRDRLLGDLLDRLKSRFPSLIGAYNTWEDTLTVDKKNSSYETTYGTAGGDTSQAQDYGPDEDVYDNKWDGSNDAGSEGDLVIRF